MTADPKDGPIVLFDGVCVFCSASVRFICCNDRTRSLRFAALQSPAGRALAEPRGLEIDQPVTFYILLPDEVLMDVNALRFIARHLKWPVAPVGWLAYLPRFIVVPTYHLIARNRYRIFGRYDTCYVPTTEERDRFLE